MDAPLALSALEARLVELAVAETAASTPDQVDEIRRERGLVVRRRERLLRETEEQDRLRRQEYRLISLAAAAEVLGVHISTAKKLARRGAFPGCVGKLGGQWRVNEQILLDFATGRTPGDV